MSSLNVLLVEPYYGGSGRAWVDSFRRYLQHHIETLPLPARFWKWRLQGGAVISARMYRERELNPDVILASDRFRGNELAPLLRSYLTSKITLDTAAQRHIAQFDRSVIVPRYDSALDELAAQHP